MRIPMMLENTHSQWNHLTSNTHQPATNTRPSGSCTPPVPDKIFDLGQNSSTSSSFTQMKVLKQWRHSERFPVCLEQNIDTVMSRLHEMYKQGQKLPHKSGQNIHVNTSDSYCLQPTAVTSDFTAMSTYTYSDLLEEQLKTTDLKHGQPISVRSGKKSLIPVRSAPKSCYIRKSLTDACGRHQGHEGDLAVRRSSTTSDVANISTLPTDSRGSETIKSHLPKATTSLHSRAVMKTKHASLIGQERRHDQTETLFISCRTNRTKISAATSMSEAIWRDDSTAGTDGNLRAGHQLNCGDTGADTRIDRSRHNRDSGRVDGAYSCQMSSCEHGSLVPSFCRTNEECDSNTASQWHTARNHSADCLSPAPCLHQEKSFTAGLLPRDQQPAQTSTSFKASNLISSMQPEDFHAKKETHGEGILAGKLRRPLGPRSRSCIPVRKRPPSNETACQHRFVHNCGAMHLGTFAGISADLSHSRQSNTRGKKSLASQPTTLRASTAEIASSAVKGKVQAVKTNKPPLPKQRFRSNMSSVKPMTSKPTAKREVSMQTSSTELHLQTSSVTPPQTGHGGKQSPCTRNRAVATEPQSPKQCCKQRTDDCSAFRLLSIGSTSVKSLRIAASKSSLVTSHQNPRQLNQQTRNGAVSVQQPVLKSVAEPGLKLHEGNLKANKIMSRPELPPAESADKQRQSSQQRLVKSSQTSNAKLKQTPTRPQPQQEQSKQIEVTVSQKRHQIQDARGDKIMTPIVTSSHGMNAVSCDKKTRSLSTVEENPHTNNDKGSIDKITELQKPTSKPPKDSGPANKDSKKEVVAMKGLQPHEDEKSPLHIALAISNSPNEKPRTSCPKERKLKHSKRSKCGLNCEKRNNSKASLHSGHKSGRQMYKNTAGKESDSPLVYSMDKLNTHDSTNDTDCESSDISTCAVSSPSGPNVVQQESETNKKAYERERKSRNVAWNTSESEVLIKTSRRQKGQRKALAWTDNKTRDRTCGFPRDAAPACPKRAGAEDAQDMPTKPNKRASSPHRAETKGYVNSDLVSAKMDKTPDSCPPQAVRGQQQSLAHQYRSAINSDLDKQLASPTQTSKPSEVGGRDDDDDDKIIQANLEETLIRLYQTQNSLHLRVMTLQDSIKQLRAGLSLIQRPPKADSERDFQWEGTVYDYFMLLGFMLVQFCIQSVMMTR